MKTTWKPTVAGVLDIVCGCFGIIFGLFVTWWAGAMMGSFQWGGGQFPIVLGIVAIAGGICALQRKVWWLALVGSIAALLPFWFLGIASLILIVLAREEFE